MSLSRDQILGLTDRKVVEVDVPEWGGTVFIRSLSGAERDELDGNIRNARLSGDIMGNARARLAARFICDKDGNAIFEPNDVEELSKRSGAALSRIVDQGMELNAMREQDAEKLAKN